MIYTIISFAFNHERSKKDMNKKVTLVLSLLCLASCANSGNDESSSPTEQSSIVPAPSSSQSESKEDPQEDKDALFSQLKADFVDFASYDDDVTFDFSIVAREEIEGIEEKMRMAGEGTLEREKTASTASARRHTSRTPRRKKNSRLMKIISTSALRMANTLITPSQAGTRIATKPIRDRPNTCSNMNSWAISVSNTLEVSSHRLRVSVLSLLRSNTKALTFKASPVKSTRKKTVG